MNNQKSVNRKNEKMNLKYWILSVAVVSFLGSCGSHSHDAEGNHAEERAHGRDHGRPWNHEGYDHAHETPEGVTMQEIADGQKVFFANLEDGDVVTSPLTIEFGVEGMEVVPAALSKETKDIITY